MSRRAARNFAAFALAFLFAGALVSVGPAAAQAAPDSFYVALLRDGKSELLRGDALAAKKSFRLACFGFLEHPVLLAEGLVRLALAEAALNDREEFVATFGRLAEVEERFSAYAGAGLSPEERKAFEEKVLEWASPETLRTLPSFAPLLARKAESDFAKLSPRDRYREWERRAAAEPANPRWRLLLATADLAESKWAKALSRLEGLTDGTPVEGASGSVACLRGQALARLKRCEEAIAALSTCAARSSDPLLAELEISCLLAVDGDAEARLFAASLAANVAEVPAVRKAVARIPAPEPLPDAKAGGKAPAAEGKTPPASPREEAAAPPSEPSESGKEAAPPPAPVTTKPEERPSPAAGRLSAEEERLVAEAKKLLKTVESREDLRRGFERFRPVAERYPARAELQLLAGEVAYRAGLWNAGIDAFRRSAKDGSAPTDPTLRFYYAVCLFEAGQYVAAKEVASSGLERLPSLPFVEAYLKKIRAGRP